MYHDYFLRFASEAQANSALFTYSEGSEGEDPQRKPNYPNIDVIGLIYKPTGNTVTTDGFEYLEMKPVEGWHVNVRSTEVHPELDQYAVTPVNPNRVWG